MKGYWAIPIIFGIAVMLSISVIGPAYANTIDLVCINTDTGARCTETPFEGAHVGWISGSDNPGSICHYDIFTVITLFGSGWFFTSVETIHGTCDSDFVILKNSITVRGQP